MVSKPMLYQQPRFCEDKLIQDFKQMFSVVHNLIGPLQVSMATGTSRLAVRCTVLHGWHPGVSIEHFKGKPVESYHQPASTAALELSVEALWKTLRVLLVCPRVQSILDQKQGL